MIATFMVVVGHSTYIYIQDMVGGIQYELTEYTNSIYYAEFFEFIRGIANWVYGFHMQLFFFLSGAVLALKPIPKFDDFVIAKFNKLVVPFWAAGLFLCFQ